MSLMMILRIALKALAPQQDAHGAHDARDDHRRGGRDHDGRARHRRAVVDRGADPVGRHQHHHRDGRQLHAGRRPPGPGRRQHARARRRGGDREGARRPVRGGRIEHARRRSSRAARTGARRCRAPTSTCRSSGPGRPRMGSFFTPQDVQSAAKVAVLGSVVRDQLFGAGREPDRAGHPDPEPAVHGRRRDGEQGPVEHGPGSGRHRVRAVHDGDEEDARRDVHQQRHRLGGDRRARPRRVADQISSLLRVRHKIQPGDPDDFMVRTIEEMASVRKEATQTMTALLASIAGVSLLVGGIGIMNIMLVSVTERTREIGLRMAIGARGRDVLMQFLVEAVVLSLFGGLIGIALGFGISSGRHVLDAVADGRLDQRGGGGVRLRRRDRCVLRVLSGAEGGRARSDRRPSFRIGGPLRRHGDCHACASLTVSGSDCSRAPSPWRRPAVRPAASGASAQKGGGRGQAAAAAVPVTVAHGRARSRCRSGSSVIGSAEAYSTVAGPRADHGRADVGELQGRRRREEGAGALHARPAAARGGAAAGAGQPRRATRRRPRTRGRRPSATTTCEKRGIATREQVDQIRTNAAALDATVGADKAARRERAACSSQYATITRADRRAHRRADGARGQPGARQRHDAARRHQQDRADLRVVRDSRGAARRRSSATRRRARSRSRRGRRTTTARRRTATSPSSTTPWTRRPARSR